MLTTTFTIVFVCIFHKIDLNAAYGFAFYFLLICITNTCFATKSMCVGIKSFNTFTLTLQTKENIVIDTKTVFKL